MSDSFNPATPRQKIAELDARAETLINQQNAFTTQARIWGAKRDRLNQQTNILRRKIKLLKTNRDQVNAIVKKLKMQQRDIATQRDTKQRKQSRIQEKVQILLRRTTLNAPTVKRQLNELEWKIQTRSFSPLEEAEYMKRIKFFEEQSIIHREVEALRKKSVNDLTQINLLNNQSRRIRIQIGELAAQSQKYHAEMLETIQELESLKETADKAHTKHLECRKAVNEIHQKYMDTMDQIKGIEEKIDRDTQTRHQKQLNEKMANLSALAHKKLKAKKKLTFEEFKLLRKKDLK
jgi:uncharacterized coiled-coil DUF342 family protein